MILNPQDTICALSTSLYGGAIAMIRLSGPESHRIVQQFFRGKDLESQKSYTLQFGKIVSGETLIDEVLLSLFRSPHSYTGEDMVEISCHASPFIVQRILELCHLNGARMAQPGEFSMRAFGNGKMDLSQAEAVADIIASENATQHQMAMGQMRGGYSQKIDHIRQQLIDFAALLELELDFSEEDVEFANREQFFRMLEESRKTITSLIDSFRWGNVLKKGIPVAIAGKPNAGKSTLLNALLKEEKAIVSEIAGTTRDFIEDHLQINGVAYRFVDTAGLRETEDILENKGILRSYEQIEKAELVLYLCEITRDYRDIVDEFKALNWEKNRQVIIVLTKMDLLQNDCNSYDIEEAVSTLSGVTCIAMTASNQKHLEKLCNEIEKKVLGTQSLPDMMVSNSRHLEAFQQTLNNLNLVEEGLKNKISSEFVALDLRSALQSLGSITGQISNEDVLSSIFSRFCIGK